MSVSKQQIHEIRKNLHLNTPGYFPSTSSINWCERDYAKSYYIAEFYNTVSNSIYLVFSIYFMSWLYRKSSAGRPQVPYAHIKMRLTLFSLSVCLVGIGSWFFHSTLTREGQMLDEISMLLAFMPALYSLLQMDDYKWETRKRGERSSFLFFFSNAYAFILATGIFIYTMGLLYLYDQENPFLFQSLFGICVFYALFHAIYLLRRRSHLRSEVTNKLYASECQHHHRNKKILFFHWLASCLIGFLCWNLDNELCERFTFIESLLLHSWWHVFTGYATYLWNVFILYAYYVDQMDEYKYEVQRLQQLKDGDNKKSNNIQEQSWTRNLTNPPQKVHLQWLFNCIMPTVTIIPQLDLSSKDR